MFKEIETVHEGYLRLLLTKRTKNYLQLLKISGKPSMTVKRLDILGIEILKTLNPLSSNPTKWSNTLIQFVSGS